MNTDTSTKSDLPTPRRRFRSMLWSMILIVVAAIILPTLSYVVFDRGVNAVNAQVSDSGVNQRSNYWRAVRNGVSGYSAVKGTDAGVLINSGGQDWRQLRNGKVTSWGGWLIVLALIGVVVFFLLRGRIKVERERSGMVVPRWTLLERCMHWYTAILFIILAVTGLSMLFGRTVLIPLLGGRGFSTWAGFSIEIHNVVGPFFSLGVLAMLIFWIKNNIPSAVDFSWLAKGGGIIGKAHPSAGKANGGEKLWYWIVILLGLGAVCYTGLILIGWAAQLGLTTDSRETMQTAHIVHVAGALIWVAIFFGHAYIGSVGTEGALEGMTRGSVSVEWAEQHHDLWYDEVKSQAQREAQESMGAVPGSAKSTG